MSQSSQISKHVTFVVEDFRIVIENCVEGRKLRPTRWRDEPTPGVFLVLPEELIMPSH